MAEPSSNRPRCGSIKVTLCGPSVQFAEECPNQPLEEREIRTLAYQCECVLGFTRTDQRGKRTNLGD